MKSLDLFPQRGFDADKKLEGKIDKAGQSSHGIIIPNGKYIVLYSINTVELSVEVTFLFSSKTDYAKLFR